MVDVAVQGLVHSEHEPSHTTSFPHAAHPRGSDCVMQSVVSQIDWISYRKWFLECA
jgi:hypothetical protein